jgi:hypothetical protein
VAGKTGHDIMANNVLISGKLQYLATLWSVEVLDVTAFNVLDLCFGGIVKREQV